MMTRSIALALLATVMVGGAAVNRAQAVVAGPATASAEVNGEETILNIAWICGPSRCDWHPFVPVVHHEFARNWAVPRTPGCYREKRRGHWREVCPH
jgi:hypothetical protein